MERESVFLGPIKSKILRPLIEHPTHALPAHTWSNRPFFWRGRVIMPHAGARRSTPVHARRIARARTTRKADNLPPRSMHRMFLNVVNWLRWRKTAFSASHIPTHIQNYA